MAGENNGGLSGVAKNGVTWQTASGEKPYHQWRMAAARQRQMARNIRRHRKISAHGET
jgi:hypothetical protein